MKEQRVGGSTIWTRFTVFFLLSALTVALAGCAAGSNRGALQNDQELNRMILAHEVLPDHNYYYSGKVERPNAILGIHKDYQLVSQLWTPVRMSSAQLAKWIRAIGPERYKGETGYTAAYILNPEGQRVGIWYSIMKTTGVEFLDGNQIKVNSPSLYPPSKLEAPTGINIGS